MMLTPFEDLRAGIDESRIVSRNYNARLVWILSVVYLARWLLRRRHVNLIVGLAALFDGRSLIAAFLSVWR